MAIVIQFASVRLREICEDPAATASLEGVGAEGLRAVLAMARAASSVTELVKLLGPGCRARAGGLRVALGHGYVLRMREVVIDGRPNPPRLKVVSIRREGNS